MDNDKNNDGAAIPSLSGVRGKPTEAGEYEIWCEECEEWTPIAITAKPWGLLAHCPDTGVHSLDVYHNALTAVMWRKAPPNEQDNRLA